MRTEELRISELGRIVTGTTPKTNNLAFFDGDYQFVTPSDLDWKTYYCERTERTVTEEARQSHVSQFIPANSVMVTCIGNTIGKCGISSGPCLTNQQINSIIPDEGINSRFVYYVLIQNAGVLRGIGIGGGAATPILNKTTFSNIKLQMPPKRKWDSIAEILHQYDDLMANNRRRIELLEQSARLLYREWFVNLSFPGHEHVKIVDGLPDGWTNSKVSDLGPVITGKTPSTSDSSNFDGDIPFVKTPDMHGNSIVIKTEQTLSERGANSQPHKFIPRGSVMVACIGAKLGVVSIASKNCQTNQQINSVLTDSNLTPYCYFALWDLKPRLEAIGGGATMPNVNKTKFSNLPIVMPSKGLLRAFDDIANPFFSQIETLCLANEKLKAAGELLLPRLMNGELEV